MSFRHRADLFEISIINARRQLLINVLFVKSAGPPKCCRKVFIQGIGTPEGSSTTLSLDFPCATLDLCLLAPVQANG